MTQYNTLNVELSNSQHNELKPGTKQWYWSNFKKLLSNVVGDSNDPNFLHKLLLTNNTRLQMVSQLR